MTHKLYTDGGARGNPGPGGAGAVLLESTGAIVEQTRKYLGVCTNNDAEYKALLLGLSLAKKHLVKNLDCYLDSELVVKQLKKEYKVKNERLRILFNKVLAQLSSFDSISFNYVKRDENSEADALVNKAIDEATDIKGIR